MTTKEKTAQVDAWMERIDRVEFLTAERERREAEERARRSREALRRAREVGRLGR